MPTSRPLPLAARGLAAVAAAVLMVSACDTSGGFAPNEQRWGFIYVSALRDGTGEYRVSPTAQFFRGTVTSVPDARVRTDSCFVVGDYVPPSTGGIPGVTYLDAGDNISARIGSVVTPMPRVTSSGGVTYGLGAGSTVAYNPGDSVVITVPGVTGGFPGSEVRGRSAEPFTIDPIVPSATSIPLRWSAATDPNSALIISLQYTPTGTNARKQEIRCAYTDDGLDSIPLRQHQAWSASTNLDRAVVVTRLRTAIVQVAGGAMELISTLQVPTPAP